MPATGATSQTSGLDYTAIPTYLKTFSGQNTASSGFVAPKTHCVRRVRKWGMDAGYCEVAVQLATLDTVVPGVAGVQSSPVYQMKQNDFAQVLGPVTLFSGIITEISPDIALDKAIIKIKDFRYLLDGVQSIGSWWANVGPTGGTNYREGVKAHFNKNNQPNAKWVEVEGFGFVPFFTTPFDGVQRGTGADTTDSGASANWTAITIPNPSDENTDTACYWTPWMVFLYYNFFTSQVAAALVAALGGSIFPWYAKSCCIPSKITWPVNLVNALKDFQTVDRKSFERVYHCTSVNKIIEDICNAAGPYALNMIYNDDGSNTMQIVRTRYLGADASITYPSGAAPTADAMKGTQMKRAIGGSAANDMTGPTVVGGALRESSESLFTKIIPVGDHVTIECRCCTGQTNTAGLNYGPDYVPFIWNFSDGDLDKAKAWFLGWLQGSETDLKTAFRFMFRQWRSLFCDYQMKPGFNFQTGTTQADFPVAIVNRDVLPHCLSSYFPSNAADEFARLNSRYPIPLEYSTLAYNAGTEATAFTTVPDANGLAVKGRGIISLQMLRDQDIENNTPGFDPASGGEKLTSALTYTIGWQFTTPGNRATATITAFRPNRMRFTLAIPCDHRLTNAVKMPSNQTANVQAGDSETDDSDRINTTNAERAMAIDTGGLSAYEERGGAKYPGYPIPQAIKVNGNNAPAANGLTPDSITIFGPDRVLRDDTQYNLEHANRKLREFGRLDRGGPLNSDRLEFASQIGEAVDSIQNSTGGIFPVKACKKQIEDLFAPESGRQYSVRTMV